MIIIIIIIILIILLLIYLFNNQEKFEDVKNNQILLSIQTVFILRENIPFLREWIIYHLNLGFDKIYLYDNTGSVGRNGSSKNVNKYNMNFDKLVNLSDEEVAIEMQNILNDFPNVIYVKWQPKDDKGNIIYGPILSIEHYLENYGKDSDYTAFIDIDEFIFSKNNHNLKEFIIKNNKDKYILFQKKFMDRYCYLNKNVIEIDDCIENIDTTRYGYKGIIKNNQIDIKETRNIHLIKIKTDNIMFVEMDDFRFNHYNINKKQFEYMKDFYKKDSFDFTKDTSLLKYKEIINKCNKCSDKNKFINELAFNENKPNCSV
jgi:hypothetical protein